jgi:1-deoxy-D-xylulose-5-phosphate reductoisomerase
LKSIIIYGSTGSIGTQALNIIRKFRDKFKVIALTCGSNIELFNRQIEEFSPKYVSVKERELVKHVKFNGEIFYGNDGVKFLTENINVDISLIAVSGTDGILPAYLSIFNSKIIALANKESLVSAGEFIIKKAKEKKVKIIPVDSEHSAIYQCLKNEKDFKNLILTASGGPFFKTNLKEFQNITVEQALNHPTWNMGKKITIDSATLMNKGLEIIEAKWLFNVEPDNIKVVIHPQSIVHSLVEFSDGAILAQLGTPNMEIPISYALFYPERANIDEHLNIYNLKLEFFEPDFEKFPTLKFAYRALGKGKGYAAALNKANEIAVKKFLNREIKFVDIFKIIEKIFDFDFPAKYTELDDVFEINKKVESILL